MKKKLTYLFMVLMVLMTSCQRLTREQVAEIVGQAKIKSVEKDIDLRVQEMTKDKLLDPESYEPISTDMSVVTSNMILYDSKAFVALRDLSRALEDFRQEHEDDTVSQEAREELKVLQAMADVVLDRIDVVTSRPVEFEAIDAYHQFYANDRHNHKVRKGYHFVIHKNNRITLLCDHDELLRVEALARQSLSFPPYSTTENTLEQRLFSSRKH